MKARERFVLEMCSMSGNSHDEHTIASALEPARIFSVATTSIVLADRVYKGVVPTCGAKLLISHTRKFSAKLERRQTAKPAIRHMKSDVRLDKS